MLSFGPFGFLVPWLLAAGVALPVLWWLLRAVPPRPRRLEFPAVALLRGLADPAPKMVHTPFWLLLLRMAGLAALILGLAGPVWRPDPAGGAFGADADALLIIIDAGWVAAPDWQARQAQAAEIIAEAGTRPTALLAGDGQQAGPLVFGSPAEATARLRASQPKAWPSALPAAPTDALALVPEGRLAVVWISDGLDHPHRGAWAQALAARGDLAVIVPGGPMQALAHGNGGGLRLAMPGGDTTTPLPQVLAIGPDPAGTERVLARLTPQAQPLPDPGATRIHPVPMDLPSELRNRITRFTLDGVASAGAVVLADMRTRRPKLALTGNIDTEEGQQLLDPGHYLRRAASPFADLVEGGLGDILGAAPDVVMLIDTVLAADEARLGEWVRSGGVLIRFAGPRMAAATDLALDPLLPVRLRPGGRETGGALSWGAARDLDPWPEDSPLAGLGRPPIAVRAQLMAEPGPETESRTIARLEDGTPLITHTPLGEGQLILFHVAADPAWSDLPLSGLFPSLIERLAQMGDLSKSAASEAGAEARSWRPRTVLDGWGNPEPVPGTMAAVSTAALDAGPAPGLPAGLYTAEGQVRALDAGAAAMMPAGWDENVLFDAHGPAMRLLGGWFLMAAALMLMADMVLSSMLAGRGWRPRQRLPS